MNSELHRLGKALEPKAIGPFAYSARYGEASYGTWAYGDTETNAVLRHQLRQEGFPTSGISTTPIYERAVFYATARGANGIGYVYKVDRQSLAHHGIREFVVSEFTDAPSVPEDEEVILVGGSGKPLPDDIVSGVVKVVRGSPA